MADVTGDRLIINYPTTPYTGALATISLNSALKLYVDQDGQTFLINGSATKVALTKDGDIYADRYVLANQALAVGGGYGSQGLSVDGDGLLQTNAAVQVNQPAAFSSYPLARFQKDGVDRVLINGDGTVVIGADRLVVNADGTVGLGTSTPVGRLEVRGAAAASGEARYVATVTDTTAMAAGVGGGILFRGDIGGATGIGPLAAIQAEKGNATADNDAGGLVFLTRTNDDTLHPRGRFLPSGELILTQQLVGNAGVLVDSGASGGGGSGAAYDAVVPSEGPAYLTFRRGGATLVSVDNSGDIQGQNASFANVVDALSVQAIRPAPIGSTMFKVQVGTDELVTIDDAGVLKATSFEVLGQTQVNAPSGTTGNLFEVSLGGTLLASVDGTDGVVVGSGFAGTGMSLLPNGNIQSHGNINFLRSGTPEDVTLAYFGRADLLAGIPVHTNYLFWQNRWNKVGSFWAGWNTFRNPQAIRDPGSAAIRDGYGFYPFRNWSKRHLIEEDGTILGEKRLMAPMVVFQQTFPHKNPLTGENVATYSLDSLNRPYIVRDSPPRSATLQTAVAEHPSSGSPESVPDSPITLSVDSVADFDANDIVLLQDSTGRKVLNEVASKNSGANQLTLKYGTLAIASGGTVTRVLELGGIQPGTSESVFIRRDGDDLEFSDGAGTLKLSYIREHLVP